MQEVLKNKKDVAFRVPKGVSFVRVNRETGKPATIMDNNFNVILEAFREGTESSILDSGMNSSSGISDSSSFASNDVDSQTNFDGIY
jgi:membrane carboxypeptidase/penicillin-binding protein